MLASNQQRKLRLSKPAQDTMELKSTPPLPFRSLLDFEKKEDDLAEEMAELQSEIDKVDAQEEKLKKDEAEIEEVIQEEEEYMEDLVDQLPDSGEGDEADENSEEDESMDQSDVTTKSFGPTQHQQYLAYQTALAQIECDQARSEAKEDQQEEKAEAGNKAEEEAIQEDMAEAEHEIATECVAKKDLLHQLAAEAESECDREKDEKECEEVDALIHLVEIAKEDIESGKDDIWPKTDDTSEDDKAKDEEEQAQEPPSENVPVTEKAELETVLNEEKKILEKINKNKEGGGDDGEDVDTTGSDNELDSLDTKLRDAEQECTQARQAIPAGFELKTETADEIKAVNEGCCLGIYASNNKCQPAIPQAECDVYSICAKANDVANELQESLNNDLKVAEKKCREGAKGILVQHPGKEEGPYDNLDDLEIIRMTCCLAPYDADMVYCEDKAEVAQVRTANRCSLLTYCLEANQLEDLMVENEADTGVNGVDEDGQDDEDYNSSPHVGGRDDDGAKKEAFDKSNGLGDSHSPFGVTGEENSEIDASSQTWSKHTVWLALILGMLVAAALLLIRRSKRKSKRSGNLFGDRRFARGPMPSHDSSRREWDEDAEYGLSGHSAELSRDHEDTTSFAPASATSALYGGQGFS